VWACGLMMYEMLVGEHPLWDQKDDDRKTYKQKLKALTSFNLNQIQVSL